MADVPNTTRTCSYKPEHVLETSSTVAIMTIRPETCTPDAEKPIT